MPLVFLLLLPQMRQRYGWSQRSWSQEPQGILLLRLQKPKVLREISPRGGRESYGRTYFTGGPKQAHSAEGD